MPLKIKNIPGSALFCAGTLLGLLLTCLIIFPEVSERLAKAQNNYGQTLASMTARRVIDALFNDDLVRLQAVLQDLVAHPHMLQATIHDVENNLLVQAGETRPAGDSHSSYSASIVIHDSISGYITLTLQNFDHSLAVVKQSLWTLGLIVFTVMSISLYRARSFTWIRPQPNPADKDEGTGNNTEKETTDTAETPTTEHEEHHLVYAIIHIKNHDVLKQQLTSDVFRSTLTRLENIIRDVQALYNGSEFYPQGHYYILQFHANDATNEAIFRAVCSAFLIVELASIINKVPLDLAAFVSANREDLTPAKLPVAGLVLESHAARDELIQRRLKFMEVGTEDGRSIVANFEQPFKNLLENQRKHLASLLL